MSQQTLANADAALQNNYVEPIVNAVQERTYIIDRVKKDATKIDSTGRKAVWSIHSRRNRGRRTIVEGGQLPNAGRQGYDSAEQAIAYHTYAMEITDAAIEATSGKENAFADLLTEETTGISRDMKQDIARQAYGDGTGLIGSVVTGGTGVSSFVLDTVQYLEIGDPISVVKKSDGTGGGTAEILDINFATKTITTVAAVPGVVDNTFGVYVAGNRNMEMPGLRKIADTTGVLHNVDRSLGKFAYMRARVKDAAGAVAGEDLFQQVRDSVNVRGFGKVSDYLTSYGVRRRLAATYTSNKRYNDAEATKVHGGYTAIYVDETPVIADEYMPKGEVFGLGQGSLAWFELTAPGWFQQKDGSIFHLKTGAAAGTYEATWQAFFRWYAVLGALKPGAIGRIKNCQDDAEEGQ